MIINFNPKFLFFFNNELHIFFCIILMTPFHSLPCQQINFASSCPRKAQVEILPANQNRDIKEKWKIYIHRPIRFIHTYITIAFNFLVCEQTTC